MKTRHLVGILLFISALPPVGWMAILLYQQLTMQVHPLAATAGATGSLVGFLTICGVRLAEVLWHAKDITSSKQLALTTLILLGLFAVGRETGDFGPKVYGDFVSYFRHGFVLGVPAGLLTILYFWFPENKL